MPPYATRQTGRSSLGNDEFRIEFEDDVLPAPVSRLSEEEGAGEEEDFEVRLQRTQEELLHLRHKARVVERRKEELEEMTRKEREYTRGRAEMHEKLSRTLVTLERTCAETQRRLEVLLQARDDLSRHYRVLSNVVIDDWNAPGVAEQADHALAIINDARIDYDRTMNRVGDTAAAAEEAGGAKPSPAAGPRDEFRFWLRNGFAFTLPLVTLGLVALIVSRL
jgi:hypothetical protein